MKSLKVDDILNEIEFAIAQEYIASDDLREAINIARKKQTVLRFEIFPRLTLSSSAREFFSKQLQFNEMLLALLEEMAIAIQNLQNENKKMYNLLVNLRNKKIGENKIESVESGENILSVKPTTIPYLSPSKNDLLNSMKPEAVHIDLMIPNMSSGLIGKIITRLKILYHRPSLFYTQVLSQRQANVNRILGEWILFLEQLFQNQWMLISSQPSSKDQPESEHQIENE